MIWKEFPGYNLLLLLLYCANTFTNFNILMVIETDWNSLTPLSFYGMEVVQTYLMDKMIVKLDKIFEKYNVYISLACNCIPWPVELPIDYIR